MGRNRHGAHADNRRSRGPKRRPAGICRAELGKAGRRRPIAGRVGHRARAKGLEALKKGSATVAGTARRVRPSTMTDPLFLAKGAVMGAPRGWICLAALVVLSAG